MVLLEYIILSLLGVIVKSPTLKVIAIPEYLIFDKKSLDSGDNNNSLQGYRTFPRSILLLTSVEDTAKLLNLLSLVLLIGLTMPSTYTLGKNTIYDKAALDGSICWS